MLCRLCTLLLLTRSRDGGAARGCRLGAVAVGELCSARSPGIVGRNKHGFRGGFGGRGRGSRLRANFLPRLGERTEFFRHRERFLVTSLQFYLLIIYTGCPKNSGLTVHYGVEETTVNVRKMFKKFYWTYLLIGRSLKVALNRKIILKYMY
jgi:hypothetical protein